MALPAPFRDVTNAVHYPISRDSNRISNRLPQAPAPVVSANQAVTETHQQIQTLAGGQTIVIPLPGISYYFEFLGTLAGVSNNFKGLSVRAMNSGQPRSAIIHVQGTGLRFGTQGFGALEVTNLDAANACLFTIDIGGGVPNASYDEYIDKRVVIAAGTANVVVTTPVGVNLSVQTGVTFNVGFKTRVPGWGDTLAGAATQAVADGYLGKARKALIVSNNDNALLLQILDPAGVLLASVQPATAFYLETGGTVTVKNNNAGAVACNIGEVYFT